MWRETFKIIIKIFTYFIFIISNYLFVDVSQNVQFDRWFKLFTERVTDLSKLLIIIKFTNY
jgi:hypothetical protein